MSQPIEDGTTNSNPEGAERIPTLIEEAKEVMAQFDGCQVAITLKMGDGVHASIRGKNGKVVLQVGPGENPKPATPALSSNRKHVIFYSDQAPVVIEEEHKPIRKKGPRRNGGLIFHRGT